VRKIPTAIVCPTTSAVADTRPSAGSVFEPVVTCAAGLGAST